MTLSRKKLNLSVGEWISHMILTLLCVSSMFPPLRTVPYFNYIMALCIFGWIITMILFYPQWYLGNIGYNYVAYFLLIATVILPYMLGDMVVGNRYLGFLHIPLFYLAFKHNLLQRNNKLSLIIALAILPFIIIVSLRTLIAYRTYEYASRAAKIQYDEGFELLRSGVGGYDFIYGLVFLFALLYLVTLNKTVRMKRGLLLIVLASLMIMSIIIYQSLFTIALILLVLTPFVRYFIEANTIQARLATILIFIFLALFINPLLIGTINFVLSIINENMLAQKLTEIKYFLSSNAMDQFIYHRYANYSYSLSLIVDYPLLGAISAPGFKSSVDVFAHGNHSHFIDTIAYFGLFVFILQISAYTYPILDLIKNYQDQRSSIITIYTLFVILGTINNITPSIAFFVYFVTPAVVEYSNNRMPHLTSRF